MCAPGITWRAMNQWEHQPPPSTPPPPPNPRGPPGVSRKFCMTVIIYSRIRNEKRNVKLTSRLFQAVFHQNEQWLGFWQHSKCSAFIQTDTWWSRHQVDVRRYFICWHCFWWNVRCLTICDAQVRRLLNKILFIVTYISAWIDAANFSRNNLHDIT